MPRISILSQFLNWMSLGLFLSSGVIRTGDYTMEAMVRVAKSLRLDHDFRGWGRAGSDFESGLVTFETIKPGAVVDKAGRKCAPHVNVWIVARGINIGLNTRLYFSDEEAANAADPVLNLIEQPVRRKTLIAARSERGGKVVYSFTINLQGPEETVFFDV